MSHFVNNTLKSARDALGLSQTDLARLSNVDRSLVSHIELGKRSLSPSLAKLLLASLPFDFLSGLTDSALGGLVIQSSRTENSDHVVRIGVELITNKALSESRPKLALKWGNWLSNYGRTTGSFRIWVTGNQIVNIAFRNLEPIQIDKKLQSVYSVINEIEESPHSHFKSNLLHTSYREAICYIISSADFAQDRYNAAYVDLLRNLRSKLNVLETSLIDESLVAIHYEMLARSECYYGSVERGYKYLLQCRREGVDSHLRFPQRITGLRLQLAEGKTEASLEEAEKIILDAKKNRAIHFEQYVRKLVASWF